MKNKWDNHDPMSYSGIQLDARYGTSYGMYVFSGWCNTLNDPTVTGLFLQSIQPPVIYYPELTKLWRWTEYDWEFVPHTTSTFIERTECIGTYPNAVCKEYLAGSNVPVDGLTANTLAKQIGLESQHEDIQNWGNLINKTGTNSTGNMYWKYADDWQKPRAMPAPQNEPFMTINFWRSPEGSKKVSASSVVDAAFIPGKSETVSGAAMTNEQYVTAKSANGKTTYDPKEFHTYTIVWTPDELSYYIDAPNGGKQIENALPVKTFKIEDYPGLEMTGEGYPGGDQKWWFYGEQKKLGDMLIMLNHYFDPGWGGVPSEDFVSASTYVRDISYFPLKNGGASSNVTSLDFEYDAVSNPDVIDFDFSTMSKDNWHYMFQKKFAPEVAGDFKYGKIVKNPAQMDIVEAPDGKQALELRLSRFDDPASKQNFFYVVLDTPSIKDGLIDYNERVKITIDDKELGAYASVTNVNTINMDAFWAPAGSLLEIKGENLNTGAINSCKISIENELTWKLHSCVNQSKDMQFLNAADGLASNLEGNQGRIPIHVFGQHTMEERLLLNDIAVPQNSNTTMADYKEVMNSLCDLTTEMQNSLIEMKSYLDC